MKRTILKPTILFLALTALACGGGVHEDPILLLSADEALEQGKELLTQEKYRKAEQLLTHAFEVEPNSRQGREALLLAADALFLGGGTESYIRCEAKYRDFLNRFPTSERADYAQFQVANCLAERVEKPDRDQSVTHKALDAYQELMRLYPTSPYAAEARVKIDEVTDRLATHELMIGHFYLRFRVCQATIQRLEYLLENYPDYGEMDQALLNLGLAYDACNRLDDAEDTFSKLRQRYPDSPTIAKIEKQRKKVEKLRKKMIRRSEKRRGRFRPSAPEEPAEGSPEGGAESAPQEESGQGGDG